MDIQRLYIKDFCAHSETEIDFTNITSALIVGTIRDNENFSNGSGKSTIFNAIEYVLFNEVKFSTLEKIIRDGCDICQVEIDFISSLDGNLYRITRANSRKTGTDIKLQKKNNHTWENLTQRRVSDTEKEISKIVGFNYKAFCASSIFSQAGSENNIQREYGNLPSLTKEKRKAVLREVLQLNNYIHYEKLAKQKYTDYLNRIEKNNTIISTLGDPNIEIEKLEQDCKTLSFSSKTVEKEILEIKNQLATIRSEISTKEQKVSITTEQISVLSQKKKKITESIEKYSNVVNEFNSKLEILPEDGKRILDTLNLIKEKIKDTTAELVTYGSLEEDRTKLLTKIADKQSKIKFYEEKLEELSVPMPVAHCKHCRQKLTDEYRNAQLANIKEKISEIETNKKQILQILTDLSFKLKELDSKFTKSKTLTNVLADYEKREAVLNKDLENRRLLFKEYKKIIDDNLASKNKKIEELKNVEQTLNLLLNEESHNIIINEIRKDKIQEKNLEYKREELEKKFNNFSSQYAVNLHKINQFKQQKEQLEKLNSEITSLQKNTVISSKVVQAFSSNGIPSLIIANIIDELQFEANNWLSKLRPGLQLQFLLVKDKDNGEQDDTLDILYFIDGNSREYKQLSGAQKIIISLAIKLSLIFIMNKKLGIKISVMLLDEVDQVLDSAGVDVFADIIKILQDELKILVITHNKDLQLKFSNVIMVYQDENNVSRGILTTR